MPFRRDCPKSTSGAPTARRFAGKDCLVTGAANGIGRAVALRLAAEGARVIAADLDLDGARETARLGGAGSVGGIARCPRAGLREPACRDGSGAARRSRRAGQQCRDRDPGFCPGNGAGSLGRDHGGQSSRGLSGVARNCCRIFCCARASAAVRRSSTTHR